MTAYILNIGDEILIGQILNTNAHWLATELTLAGIKVERIITLADERTEILATLDQACQTADLILLTGGLGPTKDDITKKTLADYFEMELVYHPASFDNIVSLFTKFGRPAPDERYKIQAHMPVGAEILINKIGTASGMWFKHKNGAIVCSMPGVPREMKYLVSQEVLPRIQQQFKLPTIVHQTLLSFGKGETDLSTDLESFETALPPHIKLAYLPNTSTGYVRLRLTARGKHEALLKKEVDELLSEMRNILGDVIVGYDDQPLEFMVGKRLRALGLTVANAESCTGGNIAHKITSIPGCSDYYMGSVVAYSYQTKIDFLGVQPNTLEHHGAVSESTVKEMVMGTLSAFKVDYAMATSGIAGPGGGIPTKPVGTVWVAVGNKEFVHTKKLELGNNRERNIQLTTNIALSMLNKQLLNLEKNNNE